MPYLVAAIIMFGALCLLNFALTLGLIQRLRDLAAEQAERPRPLLGIGLRPAAFTATTLDGERVDQDTIAGSLVGFFTPNCAPCRDQAPQFIRYAREAGLDRGRVLAVIQGDRTDAAEMVDILGGAARVVVEDQLGPTYQAFGVNMLPALCLLNEDGTVRISDGTIDAFPIVTPTSKNPGGHVPAGTATAPP